MHLKKRQNKLPKVILISGHAQNGKDTAARAIKEAMESKGRRVLIAHFADLVKYTCKTFFGWNGEKDDYGRTLLQRVGTDLVRSSDPDFWVKFIVNMLTFFKSEWDYVIIPDTRFPNEISGLEKAGFKVKHIRVVRYPFDNGLTDTQKTHPSETALDTVVPDEILLNNGDLNRFIERVKILTVEELYE